MRAFNSEDVQNDISYVLCHWDRDGNGLLWTGMGMEMVTTCAVMDGDGDRFGRG